METKHRLENKGSDGLTCSGLRELKFTVPEPGGINAMWNVRASADGINVDDAILIPWAWVVESQSEIRSGLEKTPRS